jgi:hypothetical protein
MKQTHSFAELEDRTPRLCEGCGGLMRLIGSEAHPRDADTDLLTYVCMACEEFLVVPVKIIRPASGTFDGMSDFRRQQSSADRIVIPVDLPAERDNSHVTPIACDTCGGKAHLSRCEPCAAAPGVRDTWTFHCEACGNSCIRAVER